MLNLLVNFIFLCLKVSGGGSFPPPLSAKEEAECFRLMREEGDEKARARLIEHNLRLVAHIVKKYNTEKEEQDDLISIGTIGLIKAVDSFDFKNGARFATYASKCLQNEILMYFRSKKKTQCEVSINETIDTDKDGNPLTYTDVISCDDTIADDIDKKLKTAGALRAVQNVLNEREREIIVLRYGLGDIKPVTQREIAKRMGISRSYVSRIEKAALEKIYESLEGGKRYEV